MPLSHNLQELSTKLRQRLAYPLPGGAAHEPMRATPVGPRWPVFEHHVPPKPGSVLILLYAAGDHIAFPLTQRADYVGAHGGQISLPGGKVEPGEDRIQAALRECKEEIGVLPESIEIIGKLTDFYVIPSNFIVTPVIGISRNKPLFIPDAVEVVRILEGNLDRLIRDDAILEKEILAARQFPMRAPHFEIEGEVVWGATAMMLNELRIVVREIVAAG